MSTDTLASQTADNLPEVYRAAAEGMAAGICDNFQSYLVGDRVAFEAAFPVGTGSPDADTMYQLARQTFVETIHALPDEADPTLLLTPSGAKLQVIQHAATVIIKNA